MQDLHNREKTRRTLWLLTAAALLLIFALAAITEKYPYDQSCFTAWALRMASNGPRGFYAEDYFCDYPPGYMLLLWLPGKLLSLPLFESEKAQAVVLALWPALSAAACGPVVYYAGEKHTGPEAALRSAAAALFCPAMLYDVGIWGQIDSVFALGMLVCFVLLEEKKYLPAAVFYGISLAIKPQALLAGPALAAAFLLPLFNAADVKQFVKGIRTGILGVLCALAPVALAGLPFWGFSGLISGLIDKYTTTTSSYPYATINACNFLSFLGGEWTAQDSPITVCGISLLTWQQFGTVFLVVWTLFILYFAYRAGKKGTFSPLLFAALYAIGVYTFTHRMHERYILFAVILLLAAAARFADRRLLVLAGGFSLTATLNLAMVYSVVGSDDEFLSSAVSAYMLRFVGLAVTVLFGFLVHAAWQLCMENNVCALLPQAAPETGKPGRKLRKKSRAAEQSANTEKQLLRQPPWTRREAALLAALTLAAACVSFFALGDLTAPQNGVDTNGSSETAQSVVELSGEAVQVWVYPGLSSDNGGTLTVTNAEGEVVVDMSVSYGNPFVWQKYDIWGSAPYTIESSDCIILEMSFRDADGNVLQVLSDSGAGENTVSALFDEADLVPKQISYKNSFYFDEIYHARTGYELLHGLRVYETTHPPLGKDFIALGIAIFGMTGFGWRFFGTLFGVLLLPMLYLFVRRITAKPKWAGFAALLFAFDFMRYTQSRLATIDTYVVFFILLSAYWMVVYAQSVLTKGVQNSILPMGLCGAAFGLGCASKWSGIYAGAGLAILYFGVLFARGAQLVGPHADAAQGGAVQLKKEVVSAVLGGFAFFVILPLVIYIASYAPYLLYDSSFDLTEWWNCQKYMYWYHSTLEATHPFSSCWYAWLFDLRPVWYYMGSGLQDGYYASIAGFLNPVIAFAGLAAWLRLCAKQLTGRGSRAGAALIILLLSQLLPWILVTRCTFLYHYFPCLPFLIAAIALTLSQWEAEAPETAKRAAIVLLVLAAVLFVWFYPVLSGMTVPRVWAASLKWLSSWGFYIL